MTGSLPHTLGYVAQIGALAAGLVLIGPLTRGRPDGRTNVVLALGCLAMAAASFLASDPPGLFSDFRIAYYPAGRAMLTDPASLHALLDKGVSGFVNLPAVAYLFAPFAALPLGAAETLFAALTIAAVGVAWRLLVTMAGLDRAGRWRLALLFAANGPLIYSLREGNLSHMILLPLAAGLILLRQGRSASAGAVLAAAAILKPPLALMGLLFLLRRDARGMAGFAGTGASAAALSLLLFGWAENLHWLQACVLTFNRQWIAAFNVQSFPAFLLRLTSPADALMDWTGREPAPSIRLAAQVLTAAPVLGAFAALLRGSTGSGADGRRDQLDLSYLLILCLCVVTSPLAWSHYYAWLLMPVAWLLQPDRASAAARWSAILLLSPLVWPLNPASPVLLAVWRAVWSSQLLLAGLMVLALLSWRLARARQSLPSANGVLTLGAVRRQMT